MRSRVILLCAALAIACGASEPAEPLHVLLVSVDTLRADHVGAYGYTRDTTPRLDAFFSQGTRYENAVTSAPCTIPAIPQFLTSRYVLDAKTPTLAEILRARGYRTHAIASQHQFRSSSQREESLQQMASQVQRGFQGFDLQAAGDTDHHGLSTRSASEVSDRALAWLEQHADAGPFFLWLHYFDPHDPYEPPAAFRVFGAEKRSARGGDRRRYLQAERRSPDERWQRAGYIFDAEDVAHLVALYDGEIRYTDAEIGRVFDHIEQRGLLEHTLVIFLSDHGEWLGEGDRWDHCMTLREPEMHVPLLLRLRGRPLDGAPTVAARVSSLDVVPTVLGVLGAARAGEPFAGLDLRRATTERRIFSAWGRRSSVYLQDWVLVHSPRRNVLALYDLADDPQQRKNVIAEQDRVGRELTEALARFREDHWQLVGQNDAVLEQLRALGYIDSGGG